MDDLSNAYRGWIEEAIIKGNHSRDGKWTESVAVGSERFVNATKEKLGAAGKGREVMRAEGTYVLRESPALYRTILGHENDGLRPQNAYIWDDNI